MNASKHIRVNTGSRCSVKLRLEFAVTARRFRSLFARRHRRFGKPLAWREKGCTAIVRADGGGNCDYEGYIDMKG